MLCLFDFMITPVAAPAPRWFMLSGSWWDCLVIRLGATQVPEAATCASADSPTHDPGPTVVPYQTRSQGSHTRRPYPAGAWTSQRRHHRGQPAPTGAGQQPTPAKIVGRITPARPRQLGFGAKGATASGRAKERARGDFARRIWRIIGQGRGTIAAPQSFNSQQTACSRMDSDEQEDDRALWYDAHCSSRLRDGRRSQRATPRGFGPENWGARTVA